MSGDSVLKRPTLVLNRRWLPIRTAPVQEAIGLVAKGAAVVLEPLTFATHDLASWNDASRGKLRFGESVIRSPRSTLLPPEVLVLTVYEGPDAPSRSRGRISSSATATRASTAASSRGPKSSR